MGRGHRQGRRDANWWAPLNQAYREYIFKEGAKPDRSWLEGWFEQNGDATWPNGDKPSIQHAWDHCKCLRTLDQARDYFRAYRARKKDEREGFKDDGADASNALDGRSGPPSGNRRRYRSPHSGGGDDGEEVGDQGHQHHSGGPYQRGSFSRGGPCSKSHRVSPSGSWSTDDDHQAGSDDISTQSLGSGGPKRGQQQLHRNNRLGGSRLGGVPSNSSVRRGTSELGHNSHVKIGLSDDFGMPLDPSLLLQQQLPYLDSNFPNLNQWVQPDSMAAGCMASNKGPLLGASTGPCALFGGSGNDSAQNQISAMAAMMQQQQQIILMMQMQSMQQASVSGLMRGGHGVGQSHGPSAAAITVASSLHQAQMLSLMQNHALQGGVGSPTALWPGGLQSGGMISQALSPASALQILMQEELGGTLQHQQQACAPNILLQSMISAAASTQAAALQLRESEARKSAENLQPPFKLEWQPECKGERDTAAGKEEHIQDAPPRQDAGSPSVHRGKEKTGVQGIKDLSPSATTAETRTAKEDSLSRSMADHKPHRSFCSLHDLAAAAEALEAV